MASGRYGPAMAQVARLFAPTGTATAQGEASLLDRFARHRDEAAFEALIARHGPMVLGVCRRALDRPDDVEDAFQATFLVLARRAGSIRDGDRLGPWLHGVARRVTARARARSAIQRFRERPSPVEPASLADPATGVEAAELRASLDIELSRLPNKYREPLVLCYLEGLTHDEAAARLGWPVGTVRSRMAAGRDRLRSRLDHLGHAPSAGLTVVLSRVPVPEALISTTTHLATVAGVSIPAQVATLMQGALMAMMWKKTLALTSIGLAASLAAGGVGVLAYQEGAAREDGPPAAVQHPTPPDATQTATLRKDLDAANDRIKRLEQDLANLRTTMAQLDPANMNGEPPPPVSKTSSTKTQNSTTPTSKSTARSQPKSMMGPGVQGFPGMMMGGGMVGMGGGMGGMATTQPGQPLTMGLGNSKILTIPSARDRATVHDLDSGTQETWTLPSGLRDLSYIASPGVGAFILDGDRITQVAAFSDTDGKWHPQDLKEPALGGLSPIAGPNEITYRIGRYLYIFRTKTNKWIILDLE